MLMHELAARLHALWDGMSNDTLDVITATESRDELEALRLAHHAQLRLTKTGVYGWSASAATWACVARADAESGSDADGQCALDFDAVAAHCLAVATGPLAEYTREEIEHAMRVVSARWLHLPYSTSLVAYVRALELAAGRRMSAHHADNGAWVSFCTGWVTDAKSRLAHHARFPVVCAPYTEPRLAFFATLAAAPMSDAARATLHKLASTAWIELGANDAYLRHTRREVLPAAPKLCAETVLGAYVSWRHAAVYDGDVHALPPPIDDPITRGLATLVAFDSWLGARCGLQFVRRFVLMAEDFGAAETTLLMHAREPVVVQRMGGFDVYSNGHVLECAGDVTLTIRTWCHIIATDFGGMVLQKYILPRLHI